MTTHIAFLRAINVTGRFIKMAALTGHFHALGYADARTYINTGNVVFTARARSAVKLASTIEDGLAPLLGFKSEVFLRTAAELIKITQQAIDLRARVSDDGEVNVAFLQEPLTQEQTNLLSAMRSPLDDFIHDGPQIYWICQGNQMQSKFSNAALERKLKLRTTFRRVGMLQNLLPILAAK